MRTNDHRQARDAGRRRRTDGTTSGARAVSGRGGPAEDQRTAPTAPRRRRERRERPRRQPRWRPRSAGRRARSRPPSPGPMLTTSGSRRARVGERAERQIPQPDTMAAMPSGTLSERRSRASRRPKEVEIDQPASGERTCDRGQAHHRAEDWRMPSAGPRRRTTRANQSEDPAGPSSSTTTPAARWAVERFGGRRQRARGIEAAARSHQWPASQDPTAPEHVSQDGCPGAAAWPWPRLVGGRDPLEVGVRRPPSFAADRAGAAVRRSWSPGGEGENDDGDEAKPGCSRGRGLATG